MAYAFVQRGAGVFTSTVTWGTGATGAGNLLVMCIVDPNVSGTEFVSAIAGNVNTTQTGWASCQGTFNTSGSRIATGSSNSNFGFATLVYLPGASNAGGDTTHAITFANDGGGNRFIGAMEFSGLASISPFVNYSLNAQTNPGTGTNALTSTTVNVSTVPALLAGFAYSLLEAAASGFTGTGFSGRLIDPVTTYMWGEDRRITVSSNVAATFTDASGATDTTLGIGIAFSEPSVGPPPVSPFGPMPKQIYIMP